MVAVCRMHSPSRGWDPPALSSGESEIIGMSEGLKDAIYVKDTLFFLGFVDLQIEMCTDASDAKAFVHRLGVGRMHHLDVRLCYLKYQQKLGVFVCSKVVNKSSEPP